MNKEQILEIIRCGENSRVQFKEHFTTQKQMAEELVAMANAKGGMMKHGIWKLKRVMRLVRSYPEEALWEPVFRVWHLGWRMMNG